MVENPMKMAEMKAKRLAMTSVPFLKEEQTESPGIEAARLATVLSEMKPCPFLSQENDGLRRAGKCNPGIKIKSLD